MMLDWLVEGMELAVLRQRHCETAGLASLLEQLFIVGMLVYVCLPLAAVMWALNAVEAW